MSFFLSSGKTQASQQAAVSGLQLQSSAYGKVIPILYGSTILAPNLIWYGDFIATAHQSAPSGSGKGGVGGGGGGKGGGGSTSYSYSTAVAMGLCEGPIDGTGAVYVDKNVTTAPALGLGIFGGTYGQAPWGYLETNHPDEAVAYPGIAYLAAGNYALGSSPQLPNHNIEIFGVFAFTAGPGSYDADPSLVVADFLTNPHYGCGFPASRLASLANYQDYCIANGLWISPAYTSQSQASGLLDAIATATNSAFVWSSGVLSLVPYGDAAVTANGFTYTPPATPLFDLGDDDFLLNANSSAVNSNDPVQLSRARPSDTLNVVRLECLDRTNNYNPAIVEATDQALIEIFGRRASPATQTHQFADINAARLSAQLQLHRNAIRNTYRFTLDQRYIVLDPMDIVTLTDAALGLNRQWVRILEITENDDMSLNFVAEEYLTGTGSAPLYSFQRGKGFSANYNAAPGAANAPVIFEPTAFLAESLEVWVAASGGPLWGGADIYISTDNVSYRNAGRVTGSARTGVLTAILPSTPPAATGSTIDTVHTIRVDLSQSGGQLLSGSQADALAMTTLCYVDGEFIAYQTATLTSSSHYALSTLVRGAYGSQISPHAAKSAFARIDDGVLKVPYTQDYIGKTLYIKLVSFNLYGGGQLSISNVAPYAYQLQGTAFTSPLPDVSNLRSSYVASLTQLMWDEVTDFRNVSYEIRKGTSWSGGQFAGRVAHPPFTAVGNGTYWVAAYRQPTAGLQIYSAHPQSLSIQGAQITQNVIASYDEHASGWTGATGGAAVVTGGLVRTAGNADILGIASFLAIADLINFGGDGNGTYEIPVSHRIDIGRVAACNILVSVTASGQHIDDNVLIIADFLNFTDLLDSEATANIDVYAEIATSPDGTTWSAWQKYTSGAYMGRVFKARVQLITYDPDIEALMTGFVFGVDVPDRDDHYVGLSLAAGGTTIPFKPDGAAAAAPFNGGPNSAFTPAVQVSILNAQPGDVAILSALSLSSCTVQVKNGSAGVARSVNLLAQGY